MWRRPKTRLLWSMLLGLMACSVAEHDAQVRRASVVDGHSSPEEVGLDVYDGQQQALVAQSVNYRGADEMWCSATVVGSRMVFTAAHCLVANWFDWYDGEPAELFAPDEVVYLVGDTREPACELSVDSIHIPEGSRQGHDQLAGDVAFVVLEQSVAETCPELIPVPARKDPVTEELIGQSLYVGGYGFTSPDVTVMSPIRLWARQTVTDLDWWGVMLEEDMGFPIHGDSGSGLLGGREASQVEVIAAMSAGDRDNNWALACRYDLVPELVEEIAALYPDDDLFCGPFSGAGLCRGDLIVSCADGDFEITDCAERQGYSCDPQDPPVCLCACDQTDECDPQCPCDEACSAGDGGPDGGADGGADGDADADGGDADSGDHDADSDSDADFSGDSDADFSGDADSDADEAAAQEQSPDGCSCRAPGVTWRRGLEGLSFVFGL